MHGEHAGATANSSRAAARAKASGAERTVARGRAAALFMETITGEQDWMGVVLLDELLGNSGAQGDAGLRVLRRRGLGARSGWRRQRF